jgi:hypothetical protein
MTFTRSIPTSSGDVMSTISSCLKLDVGRVSEMLCNCRCNSVARVDEAACEVGNVTGVALPPMFDIAGRLPASCT